MTTSTTTLQVSGNLSAFRCALTGAAVLVIEFAMCWLGTLINIPGATHVYLSLFASVPIGTLGSLIYGSISSAIVGLITGALIAFTYNAFGFLSRR
jgi:hypothetical protein